MSLHDHFYYQDAYKEKTMPESKDQYEKRLRQNHETMTKTGVTKLPYDKFRDRQENANKAQEKKAYDERKIRL